jgi:hypothetical protein
MEIQLQKESSRCMQCDAAFRHEEKHFSLLRIEDELFIREDYCERCWPECSAALDMGRVYSYWETKYRDPAVARATPREQFVPLLSLCYESIAQGDPEGEATAYLCALILRRQKVFRFLREEAEETSGRTVLVFSDQHNDTQIRIIDPQLTDSQLQEVRQKIEERIGDGGGQANEQ